MKLKYSKVPQSTPNIPKIIPSLLKSTSTILKSLFNILKSSQKWPNMVNFYIFQPEIRKTLEHVGNTYIYSILDCLGFVRKILGYEANTKVLPTYSKVLPMYSTVIALEYQIWLGNLDLSLIWACWGIAMGASAFCLPLNFFTTLIFF